MTMSLWTLAAYAIQLAALVTVALAATWLLRHPRPAPLAGDSGRRSWRSPCSLPLAQPRSVSDPAALQFLTQSIVVDRDPAGRALRRCRAASTAPRSCCWILAAGIVARLLWLGVGLIRLRSIVARARRPTTRSRASADDLTRSLGVTAAVRISDDLEGPATVGVRHPLVLLPRSVLQHVRRRAARDHLPRARAREAPRLAPDDRRRDLVRRCCGSIRTRA